MNIRRFALVVACCTGAVTACSAGHHRLEFRPAPPIQDSPIARLDTTGRRLPAPTPFDLYFRQGRYDEALAVYRADTTLHRRERTLFHVGLLHAEPASRSFDLDTAREHFERLVELYPESQSAVAARVILGLIESLDSSRLQASTLRQQLEELKAVDLRDPP